MSDHDGVDPKGPLGIPAARGSSDGGSHHSPGFDETQAQPQPVMEAADTSATPLTAEMPPAAPDKVPRASLTEQLAKRSAEERAP